MNENETRIVQKLAEQAPKLSKARLEKLGQIMELTALVASVYEEAAGGQTAIKQQPPAPEAEV